MQCDICASNNHQICNQYLCKLRCAGIATSFFTTVETFQNTAPRPHQTQRGRKVNCDIAGGIVQTSLRAGWHVRQQQATNIQQIFDINKKKG